MKIHLAVTDGREFFEKNRKRLEEEAVLVAENSVYRIYLTNEYERPHLFVELNRESREPVTARTVYGTDRYAVEDAMRALYKTYIFLNS